MGLNRVVGVANDIAVVADDYQASWTQDQTHVAATKPVTITLTGARIVAI